MKIHRYHIIVLFLLVFASRMASAQLPMQVEVEGGWVKGVRENDLTIFRGVPFAAPPLGPLRWKAPQPVVAWEGVRPLGGTTGLGLNFNRRPGNRKCITIFLINTLFIPSHHPNMITDLLTLKTFRMFFSIWMPMTLILQNQTSAFRKPWVITGSIL